MIGRNKRWGYFENLNKRAVLGKRRRRQSI